jgi:transcriptional regulator with XRE-family HTH domain
MEEKKIAKIFAKNVVFYRKKQGYSQYDLAMQSGISRTMISHYEREGMLPPADRLQILANSLGIPVYKLFRDSAEEKTQATDISDIDPRSVKKLRDILSLPPDDRNDLYRILNKMLRKNQLEKYYKN